MVNKYLLLSITNIRRRKKTVIMNILIISISLFVFLLMSTVSVSIDNYLNKYLLNTLNFRTIHIDTFKPQKEQQKEGLQKVINGDERIIDFYEENYGAYVNIKEPYPFNISESNKSDRFFGGLSLNTITKAYKEYMVAGDFIKDGEKNVGIIPKKFLPSGSFQIGYWQEENEFIDGESLIGETITVEYYARDYSTDNNEIVKTFSYSFKVIGVYDILPNQNYPYDVYIPFNELQNIIRNLEENDLGLAEDYNISYSAIVKEQSDVKKIIQKLWEAGYSAAPRAVLGEFFQIANSIIIGGYILGFIVLIVGVINISLSMFKAIERRIGEIGLMKAIGYKDSNLITILGIEAIVIGGISYILSVVVYVITTVILKQFMVNNLSMYMQQLVFNVNYIQVIKCVIIAIFVPLISSLFSAKMILNISPMDALEKRGIQN